MIGSVVHHLKYYPQRTIGVVNALCMYLIFKLNISPEESVLVFGVVNALLILFYGEKNTNSRAWVEETYGEAPE